MPLTDYVTLGRSGLRVSPFCLGAMTFGEDWGWGSPSPSPTRIIDRFMSAAEISSTPPTSTRRATRRKSSATTSPAADVAATASCWRPSSSATSTRAIRTAAAPAARHRRRVRTVAAPAPHALHRSVLDALLGPAHADRGDDARAGRPRQLGQGPLHRLLRHARVEGGPGADDRALPRLGPLSRCRSSTR